MGNDLNFQPPEMRRITRIHFVGIGGSGMSGIAEVLLNQGYQISGSDISTGPTIKRLKASGMVIYKGHAKNNIEGADVVVKSSAVTIENPEIYREALNSIIEYARTENLRRTEEVDVPLNGTISLYRMDLYSYSHKVTLRENQPFFAMVDENVRRFIEEHPEGRDTDETVTENMND